ncbi:hypothetical protein EV356DRAFT_504424 [Viridothelium virens]|uniref:Uncharacterized protein n=1 Tax=Viridothelium virens TaxID=1048519 RepID=A0A6A6HNC9_VIRVR|nr:hypothetical protein EV356DRAFT_504424 [Viridothelium virens]
MSIDQPQEGSLGAPNIRTKRDLTNLCEVEDYETGAFKRSTFTYVDDEDIVWFGQAPGVRKFDLTTEDLNRLLQRIPDEKIYPLKTASTSIVSKADRKKLYVKRPK